MEDIEYGVSFDIWLERPLSTEEKTLLINYENYLMQFKGYSFIHEFKVSCITTHEKNQLHNSIGYIPEEEICISGLATPVFRSIEAILKHFGGYAKIGPGNDPIVNGKWYKIRESNGNIYYLSNWEILNNTYNLNDSASIKEIYSIQRLELNLYI